MLGHILNQIMYELLNLNLIYTGSSTDFRTYSQLFKIWFNKTIVLLFNQNLFTITITITITITQGHIHIAYCTVKDIGDEILGEFGKLHNFAKFFARFHNFHKFPMKMDLNSPKFFLPNFLQSLFDKPFCHQSFLQYSIACCQLALIIQLVSYSYLQLGNIKMKLQDKIIHVADTIVYNLKQICSYRYQGDESRYA